MVVSTPAGQARCLRCGAILGVADALRLPAAPAANAEPADGQQSTTEGASEDVPRGQEKRFDALATYVSLVVIAAARSCFGRGESV
jgi:uncharacterized protein YciW